MNNHEFSLYESVQVALSRWWIMVTLMVVGGLVGFGFHLFYPPVYEAKAVISININFQKRELTQIEKDTAFNAASAIITSPSVMNLVVSDAQVKGYSITPERFLRDFYLEGRQSVWELRVRDRDPNVATELANIWAQNAADALNVALTHALQADQIQAQIAGLENCLAGTSPQAASIQMDCKGYSHQEIEKMLQDQTTSRINEINLSLGIISIMTISLTYLAAVPESPILYGLAGLVLAGAFIGLVVSLWLINTFKVSHHV